MLDTLAALCLLFGGMLAISFRLAPLPPERQRWLAVTLLCVTVGIATAFHLTPNINNKGGVLFNVSSPCLVMVDVAGIPRPVHNDLFSSASL